MGNPDILIYGLSWAVPHWVGVHQGTQKGFYGQDNIDYQLAWLKCVRQMGLGDVDYIGHRNERDWGTPEYTVLFRASLDANGFNNTRIILPDGSHDRSILEHASNNSAFAGALEGGGIGLHYPCFLELPEVHRAGLKYWSSEDWDSQADWKGAGCLGRILNQNYVRMNVTATIAKYLIWSAYRNPSTPEQSNSLLFAAEPWSGHHVVHAPLWVMAHTTHFVRPGWTILSTEGGWQQCSSGRLRQGGTYITYVSPSKDHFTLVVEKLHGDCSRCIGQTTADEDLTFCLSGGLEALAADHLGFWSTNESHHFVYLSNLSFHPERFHPQTSENRNLSSEAGKICFSFHARHDTIYTISSMPTNASGIAEFIVSDATPLTPVMNLQSEVVPVVPVNDSNSSVSNSSVGTEGDTSVATDATREPSPLVAIVTDLHSSNESQPDAGSSSQPGAPGYMIPASSHFPATHVDDFEAYTVNLSPRYFADYAGSWQVAEDPTRPSNKVLKQWVVNQAQANQWAPDNEPITMIGDHLFDVSVSVDVYLPRYSVPHSGISAASVNIQSVWAGLCLGVARQASWTGAAAEALPCSPQWHEQLSFDERDGSIMLRRTNKCLSATGCPGRLGDAQRAELCFQDCCGSIGEEASCSVGQSWIWMSDRGIRPRSQPSTCITVVESHVQPVGSDGGMTGKMLRLLSCPDGAPSTRQQWLPTSTSFATYAGICARISPPGFAVAERHKSRIGYCLNLGVDEMGRGVWQLEKAGAVVLARGIPDLPTGYWHRLAVDARGSWITAMVDGFPPITVSDNSHVAGMVALNSAWDETYFDNFTIGYPDLDILSV